MKLLISYLLLALGMGTLGATDVPKRVLFFSKSAGFEHLISYRDTAWPSPLEKEMLKFGQANNIEFVFSKDGSIFHPTNIATFDAFLFFTTGDPVNQTRNGIGDNNSLMTKEGKAAFLQAIRDGKGFIGVHGAIDTFTRSDSSNASGMDEYAKMLGAECVGHGEQQMGRMSVVDKTFPGMANIPEGFAAMDEWYAMKHFAPDLHVVMALNCSGMKGDLYQRGNYPVAWARNEDRGRVFFTSLGCNEEIWKNPAFLEMLLGGIRWATRQVDVDVTPNLKTATPQANEIPVRAAKDSFATEYGKLPVNETHLKRVEAYVENTPQSGYHHPSEAAVEAFRDMKFGVRIHWGVYAMIGDASWPLLSMSNEQRAEYQEKYKRFNPVGFDADEWMRLFKTNGVKVFAFTSKHHDGFSMFDTQTRVKQRVNWIAEGGPNLESCDLAYSIMDTPFRRDIVRELCDAGRRHGLKIDLYFSHPDWYDADFRPYAMNPVRAESTNRYGALPDEFDTKYTKNIYISPDPTPAETGRMVARHRTQLTELLTRYGRIDMLCLDQWLGPAVWPEMRETIKQVRRLQPDVMLRARGIGNYGDYYTPEGWIPGSKENTTMPWMVIHKLAGTWVFQPDTNKYKGADWIVEKLADIAAKGGNFMVGIGPDEKGRFHPRIVQTLQEAGAWLKVNGAAIYGTRPRSGNLWKEGEHVRFTRTKDNRVINAVCLKWPGRTLVLKTVTAKAGSNVTMPGVPKPLSWRNDPQLGLVIEIPESLQEDANRPCKFAYVFQIEGGDRTSTHQ